MQEAEEQQFKVDGLKQEKEKLIEQLRQLGASVDEGPYSNADSTDNGSRSRFLSHRSAL